MTAHALCASARHDEAAHRRDANRAVGASAIGLALTGGAELALAEAARLAAAQVVGDGVRVRGRWMGRSLRLEFEMPVVPDARVADVEALARRLEAAVFDAVPTARQITSRPVASTSAPGGSPA